MRNAAGLVLILVAVGCGDDWESPRETKVKEVDAFTPEAPPATEPPREVVHLTWTGCDISKKAYINDAVAAYAREKGVEIIVTGGGATRGIRATAGGTSDIGGTCRHTLPERFPEEEQDALLTHVAWDALVFFTHPDNPVDGITTEQAKKILLGEIRNWKEVGGPDERIVPAFRQQTVTGKLSGVGYMTRLLLFDDPQKDYRPDAIFHTSSGPIEEFVETTPFSFAVTGVSSAKKRDVKILELDGVQPREKRNLENGDYKLIRPLYLVTKGEPKGPVKDFIDWIVSDAGQKVLSDAGTVNLAEGAALAKKFRYWPDARLVRNR